MHRILLYILVVLLLCLAWDARRDEVFAAALRDRPSAPPESLVRAPSDPSAGDVSVAASVPARSFGDPELQARLEARVAPREDVWAELELQSHSGPPAEEVLAGAEAWVEATFPEGGSTAKLGKAEDRREQRSIEPALGIEGGERLASGAEARPAAGAGEGSGTPAPVYVASIARIESLTGDLPAWCGLLDLALQPGAPRPELQGLDGAASGWEVGDTVWISDERGHLLARVDALDGFGLELDPNWPWVARQRRLFWSDIGSAGLPARQYRLVLEGGTLIPSWSGRLVFLRSRLSQVPHR